VPGAGVRGGGMDGGAGTDERLMEDAPSFTFTRHARFYSRFEVDFCNCFSAVRT